MMGLGWRHECLPAIPLRVRRAGRTTLVLCAALIELSCARASQDVSVAIARELEAAFRGTGSGGAVLMARGDHLLLRRAYGLANVELGVPMQVDHLFGTGSITKQFTAIAVLQLVERGVLSLDNDVRRYVPDLQTGGTAVTIDQVLSHTSGLPNAVDRPDFETIARLDHTVAQLLTLTHGMPMHFAPGAGFHYSDSGYFLLGAIIEQVAGMPYGQYLEKHLFGPIGMRNTWLVDGTRVTPRAASGYSMRGGSLVPPVPISMTVPYAAGGVFSTVDDLWQWNKAIRDGRVVGEQLRQRAWSARMLPDGSPSGYGYGWSVCTLAGRPTIEHGGFVNGFQANLLHLPDDDVTVIVLVNNDGDVPEAGGTARRLARLVVSGVADIAPHALTPHERAALVGHYITAAGDVREISDDAGTLSETRQGVRRSLVALSPTRLTWTDGDEGVVLTFDVSGNNPSTKYRSSRRCEPMDVALRRP
jgi:CubicO group peptidase (beta-lactamase class C family)